MIPAIIYGARQEPTLIALEPRAIAREIHKGGWKSRLFELKVGGEATRALMRDVQLHPVTDTIEHVDFQRLAAGEQIRVSVSVHFTNEAISPGLKRGGMLNVVRHVIEVWADPDHVPAPFEVDLSKLDINDNVRWHDVHGTEGLRPTIADRDFVIATVVAAAKMADVAPTEAAAAPVAAPAKGKAPAKGAAPAKAAAPTPAAKAAPKKK